MPSVYLAGHISGLTLASAVVWRNQVRDMLEPNITAFSPLRSKEYLESEGVLEGGYSYSPLSSARGIMTRDHFDCARVDAIFCNLLGCGARVSIGTVMEIAWAHAYRKPLVLVMEDAGNVHDHPMVTEAVAYRCTSIQQGVAITRAILLPRSVRNVVDNRVTATVRAA